MAKKATTNTAHQTAMQQAAAILIQQNPSRDPNEYCDSKLYMHVGQALLLLIQKTTGQQTHEIMSTIVDEYENMLKLYELDVNKKTTTHQYATYWYGSQVRKQRLITYPGTDIQMNFNLTLEYKPDAWKEYSGWYDNKKPEDLKYVDKNTMLVNLNVSIPRRMIRFETKDLADIALEGELFDFSKNIEDLEPKNSITPAEKRAKKKSTKKKTKTDSIEP